MRTQLVEVLEHSKTIVFCFYNISYRLPVNMLHILTLSLFMKTVTTNPVFMDQLWRCPTQFVTVDYKISKNYSEIVAQVWNMQTPYTLEFINPTGKSDLKSFSSSNPRVITHFSSLKYVLCTTFVYFADLIPQYTKQSVFTIFQNTQIIPFSTNPTFLAILSNSKDISVPDQTVDITSIYLFSSKQTWFMFCIPCAQKFHPIPTHETNVNLFDMWKNIHKFMDAIPLQTPKALRKWDSKVHQQECPHWDRR